MEGEQDYRLIPAFLYLFSQIDAKSDESAVQAFWDNFYAWMYPVAEGYVHSNQVLTRGFKLDNHIRSIWYMGPEGAEVDIFQQENKRLRENPKLKHFEKVAREELDKKMTTSLNPVGWELSGAIAIGHNVVHQMKILHQQDEPVGSWDGRLLHIWDDAHDIVAFHEWNKRRVKEQLTYFGLQGPREEHQSTTTSENTPYAATTGYAVASGQASSSSHKSKHKSSSGHKHKGSSQHSKSSVQTSYDEGWSQWEWAKEHNCYESHKEVENGSYIYRYSDDKQNIIT